jgi:hypothetical protein
MSGDTIVVRLATEHDQRFVQNIITEIEIASQIKGTGICKREPAFISQKITEGNAVMAVTPSGAWAGFCYIQPHDNGQFVSSCALVISRNFRNRGIASQIKAQVLALAKNKYPAARIFGLTTSHVVERINAQLNYVEVSYAEVTQADTFWQSCRSCENYQLLLQQDKKKCLCKAMVYMGE